MKLFTDEWAFALKDAINNHPTFEQEASNWRYGSVGFTVRYNNEDKEDVSLYIDMDRGVCRYTMLLSAQDAFRACDFILEGELDTWIKVFNQEQTSVTAFLTGKLKLTKGSFYKTLGMEKASICLFQAAATLMEGET